MSLRNLFARSYSPFSKAILISSKSLFTCSLFNWSLVLTKGISSFHPSFPNSFLIPSLNVAPVLYLPGIPNTPITTALTHLSCDKEFFHASFSSSDKYAGGSKPAVCIHELTNPAVLIMATRGAN